MEALFHLYKAIMFLKVSASQKLTVCMSKGIERGLLTFPEDTVEGMEFSYIRSLK